MSWIFALRIDLANFVIPAGKQSKLKSKRELWEKY
jgi:hypothetical protein